MQEFLSLLYARFLESTIQHPEIVVNKGHINDSQAFCNSARPDVDAWRALEGDENIIEKLGKACSQTGFGVLGLSFSTAVTGAFARSVFDEDKFSLAHGLAEQALTYNPNDLYVQDILLRARSSLKLFGYSYEESMSWLKGRFCTNPFKMVETHGNSMYRCCPALLPVPIGTFDAPDLMSILKSDVSEKLKESILDGSFRYCSKVYCSLIVGRALPTREEGLASIENTNVYPEEVSMSHDRSCNLSCPSCRVGKIVVPKEEQEQFDRLTASFLEPLMENAKSVLVTGSGDPFFSTHFRNLLRTYCIHTTPPVRKLTIFTNGVLCDEKAWNDVGLFGHVRKVQVSIDAATEDTYNYVRRDGDFKRLLRNLEFIGRLRREGEIEDFVILFVVQNRNFREMKAFVEMGEKYGVDHIYFNQIRSWNTYTPEEFAKQTVTSVNHPNHQEFLDILNDPIFDREMICASDIDVFSARKTAA